MMKAVVYESYGSPDVLVLKDVEKPIPKDNEVLVKIHAVSVNPLDWHLMRANPFFIRFMAGFFKPKTTILGADIAGQVEAVGKSVTQFKPGDEVFGGKGSGGLAEYICCTEEHLERKPINTSFEEAAAVFVAAVTALQSLRDKGEIKSGQQMLIDGASGGVGTYAIQIAKALGAEVTAVCSTQKMSQAKSLGADYIIDYKQEDFTQQIKRYDLVFCINGSHSISDYKRVLKSQGIFVSCGGAAKQVFPLIIFSRWLSKQGGKQLRFLMANQNKKDLIVLREFLESGKIKSVIDCSYPLAQTADAIRYLESGHARGKVIITTDALDTLSENSKSLPSLAV